MTRNLKFEIGKLLEQAQIEASKIVPDVISDLMVARFGEDPFSITIKHFKIHRNVFTDVNIDILRAYKWSFIVELQHLTAPKLFFSFSMNVKDYTDVEEVTNELGPLFAKIPLYLSRVSKGHFQ